ncbi:hypothetical protein OH773_22135 (plasmid) [Buttiauxella sp. WJP83]|uniref:hypothetical protein n=1 Tax=Buttiauxella sp. WJP83 TaxID=2986951 RepID=UPI0022DDEAA2|nr:hypothetical protein [Buttiauxella sp. WJP83]WBM72945.1 hypothetical protein OH773_22135 [Buttiauxella sp. WJP83]
MKKLALVLGLLAHPIHAAPHVYQCEMVVAEVKNNTLTNIIKASNGAMVVDGGDQFYVVRDDRVLFSPQLTKRNGKLVGVGEDKLVYNKFDNFYGVHAKNTSYLFDDCKEVD